MYRFIVWFNCIKTRFKSKRFIIPIIFVLTFLFLPNNVFAAEIDSNKVQISTQELFWDGTNAQGGYESGRFNSTQNHIYQWGTSSATYKLFRFAPLINFTSFGVDTSYKARVAFYIFVDQPYSYDDKYCTLFSDNGEKYSCSLYREMDDQIGSSSSLLTFVYDFEWTSSTGYVEFWLNFDNFYGIPNKTEFMYTILDFQGNVSGNQIILDGLGQTNKKLDKITDTLKDSFEKCSSSPNLFNKDNVFFGYAYNQGVLYPNERWSVSNLISVNSSSTYTFSSSLLSTGSLGQLQVVYFDKNRNYISDAFVNSSSLTFTTPSNCFFVSIGYRNDLLTNIQLEKGNFATSYEPYGTICKNRIDETNEKLDELNDSINDDNVSGATSTGNDFFDNFNSKDNGGISRIVTMPLTLINGLISGGTCSNLEFEVLDKEVYFPSGCILWQNAPSSIVTIYRTIICGLFSYILATHLFKDIEDLKNPNKEEVSTLDL